MYTFDIPTKGKSINYFLTMLNLVFKTNVLLMREKVWSFFAFFCWLPLFITNVWSKADEHKIHIWHTFLLILLLQNRDHWERGGVCRWRGWPRQPRPRKGWPSEQMNKLLNEFFPRRIYRGAVRIFTMSKCKNWLC